MKRIVRRVLPYFICFFALVACGGDDEFSLSKIPKIEVTASGLSSNDVLTFVANQDGACTTEQVTIKNTGEANLDVDDIKLDYQPATPAEIEAGTAFELKWRNDNSPPTVVGNSDSTSQVQQFVFDLVYCHYADGVKRTGKLVIYSNDPNAGEYEVVLTVLEGAPKITVSPDVVAFSAVTKDNVGTKAVQCFNTGSLNLEIRELLLLGHEAFGVAAEGSDYNINEAIVFDPPIIVEVGKSWDFDVTFSPLGSEEAAGRVVIMSNDPDYPSGLEIDLSGNSDLPCIEVEPSPDLDFKGQLVGGISELPVIIRNCGNSPLEVTTLGLSEDSNTNFAMSYDNLSTGSAPVDGAPLLIGVNGSETFGVMYTPSEESTIDPETGEFIADLGTLIIKNNSYESDLEMPVSGFGVTDICPTGVIEVLEGDSVIPQTTLHLKGDNSYAPAGEVTEYYWEVDQPKGSKSVFVPSSTWPNPTFQANVAGSYEFSLEVKDQLGTTSCEITYYTVVVIPDEAIHVELLWDTPNDQDQFDEGPEAGADMDLHFVHAYAGGQDMDADGVLDGWFDLNYDAYWFNDQPEWGSPDPNIDDNPGLDRDDTDGAGPENLNLNVPEDIVYRIGVHYFDDRGYGPSTPTVRVYIYTSLLLEVPGPQMNENDMWEVAKIDWTIQAPIPVTTSNGGFKVIPNYPTPIK